MGAAKAARPWGSRTGSAPGHAAAWPEDALEAAVETAVRDVAGLAEVPRDAPLMQLGVDSLAAVELRNRLAARLGLGPHLPSTLVFDCPTVQAIAAYVGDRLRELAGRPGAAGAHGAGPSGAVAKPTASTYAIYRTGEGPGTLCSSIEAREVPSAGKWCCAARRLHLCCPCGSES